MNTLLKNDTGKRIVEAFDAVYQEYATEISDMKKVDLVLWKNRKSGKSE